MSTRTDHFVDGVDVGGQKVDRQFQIQIDDPCELCGTNPIELTSELVVE